MTKKQKTANKRMGPTAPRKSKAVVSNPAKPSVPLERPASRVPKSKTNEPTQRFIVRGTVSTANDQPIRGAIVRAFCRELRKDQPRGKAKTNERGEYLVRYHLIRVDPSDGAAIAPPELIVRAFLNDHQIGDDLSRSNPKPEEKADFKVPAPQASEWEKLSAEVKPFLKGQGKGNQALSPSELDNDDLKFLAAKTGLEKEHLRLWSLAFVVGRDAAIVTQPASARRDLAGARPNAIGEDSTFAIFYGWFRLGLPTEPGALWAMPTIRLLTTLRTAITQGIIPSSVGENADAIGQRIEQIKLDRVLHAPTLGTAARLGELLATSTAQLSLDQQHALAAAAAELRPDDVGLVDRIASLPGFNRGDAAIGVARTLRLGALTAGHLPLTETLQQRLQDAKEDEGTLLPLAALRPDEWLDLAYTHGTPEGIAITPAAYANALAASVELQHPTAALLAHFTGERPLAQHPALIHVETFLLKNPAFDIVTTNLNAVTVEAKFDGIPKAQRPELVDSLRSLQRLNVVSMLTIRE